jgi:hypothetical protein
MSATEIKSENADKKARIYVDIAGMDIGTNFNKAIRLHRRNHKSKNLML